MRHRRKRALCLLVALLLAVAPAAHAVEGDTPAPAEGPQVTVAGTRVTGGEYFELGLRVTAQKFQTVGAVLSYDKAKLEPVDWTGAVVTLAKAGEAQSFWPTPPTVLHTRGLNGHAGKPALGCETEKRGYLYLGADTLAYGELADEQVVTVRFRYTEAVKTAVEGGDKLEELITAPKAAADYGKETTTIDFAPNGSAVTESIPGAQLVLTTEDAVYEQNSAKNAVSCTAAFLLAEGAGLGTEGGISGDYAVTFFDWDGRVIDAITAPQNAEEAVAEFQKREAVKTALTGKPGYKFDRWVAVNQTINGLQMLNGSGETYFTSNDTPIPDSAKAAAKLKDISPYVVDAKSKGVLLQAAYVAKSATNGDAEGLVNNGELLDATKKFYSVSINSYTRYGSVGEDSGSFGIRVNVARENRDATGTYGVTRLRMPCVVVAMLPVEGDQVIYSLVELENTDRTSFEIVPTKAIKQVSYRVIDRYVNGETLANWTGGAAKSDTAAEDAKVARTDFIRKGSLGYLAEQAYFAAKGAQTDWETYGTAQLFIDAGYPGISSELIEKARNELTTASAVGKLSESQVQTILGGVT